MHQSRVPSRKSLSLALALMTLSNFAGAAESGLEGSYIGEPGGQQALDTAIESGTAKMNFIKRPIARSRLKKTNSLARFVVIARTADEVSVKFDDRKPVASPLDGRTIKWTREDGEVFDVSARWQDALLVQTFKAEDGQRVNSFSLSPDGALLTLHVELTSPQLPAPIRYSVMYRRGEDR